MVYNQKGIMRIENTGPSGFLLRVRDCFTLIELLVVIAIIGILASLLLPALASAKNRAQKAADLNNNRQIILAAHLYASDNTDLMPSPGWGTVVPAWAYDANIPALGTTIASFPTALSNQLEYFKRGQLYPYLRDPKITKCPTDNKVDIFYVQRGILFSSYVWNGAVCGYGNINLSKPNTYRITLFKPDRVLMWETDERTPFFFNDTSSFPDEGISARHGNAATVGLFDGSTETIRLRRWYSSEFAGNPGARGRAILPQTLLPNRAWCNPGHPLGLQ